MPNSSGENSSLDPSGSESGSGPGPGPEKRGPAALYLPDKLTRKDNSKTYEFLNNFQVCYQNPVEFSKENDKL